MRACRRVDQNRHDVKPMMVDMMFRESLAERVARASGENAAEHIERLLLVLSEARARPEFAQTLSIADALADERRLSACCLLKRRPDIVASEIQAALGLAHATVTHHMQRLVEAGLVTAQKDGKWTRYRLTPGGDAAVP